MGRGIQSDMKKYKGKYIVEAALLIGMAEQDDMIALITADKDENGQNIVVMAKRDIIAAHQPSNGDYIVSYKDILEIIPGKEFEDQHTLI